MRKEMNINELVASSGVKPRSIRQYIALGLVSAPSGRTRGATYSASHLADLLTVRMLLLQGLSLAQIKIEMSTSGSTYPKQPPPRSIRLDAMRVVQIADGVILVLDSLDKNRTPREQDALIVSFAQICAKRGLQLAPGLEGCVDPPSGAQPPRT